MAELLSVIVCTHERQPDLERCLRAIAALEDPVEVVVVDSGSRTPCRTLVEGFRDKLPSLHYLEMPEPGLSRARNAGLAAARGSIVAFIDDDAAARPDWARALLDAFWAPDVGCVGGACHGRFTVERPRWLSGRLIQFAGVTRFGAEPREPRGSWEWPFGANLAFRRAALEQAGGFSATLGRTGSSLLSGEDAEMVGRVLAEGWRVWLEPRAIVDHTVHPERCRSGYYWRRLWWNGVSRARTPAPRVGLRLSVALPLRLLTWALTGERLYLYRAAETAGYFAARLGMASTKEPEQP